MGGVVVLLGMFTINGGLVASGSPYSLQAITGSNVAVVPAANRIPAADSVAGAPQVIHINATSTAYVPNYITARAGSDISLVFTTDNVWSCIRATMLPTLDKSAILPQTGSETIELGTLEPGDYPISCSMGMYTATLHVV
jgi:plastocyanin